MSLTLLVGTAITDGSHKHFFEQLYAQRAGVHPAKPILFSFSKQHDEFDEYLEPAGMARFIVALNVTSEFPLSDEIDESELLALPRWVQFFHCRDRSN